MMTTMAALLGGLPLALGSGTGAELRRPLGITIVGGLIVSQMLTLFTTPVIYLYMERFRGFVVRHRPWRSVREQEREAQDGGDPAKAEAEGGAHGDAEARGAHGARTDE
jgi:hypothetical protein